MFQYSYSNFVGIAGIVLQIIGFILLIKYYGKKPKLEEVHKWLDKFKTKHPDGLKFEINVELESPFVIAKESMTMPKAFGRYWAFKTKSPLVLNIIGLGLMIAQIVLQ